MCAKPQAALADGSAGKQRGRETDWGKPAPQNRGRKKSAGFRETLRFSVHALAIWH
jgi:hypothetical protein